MMLKYSICELAAYHILLLLMNSKLSEAEYTTGARKGRGGRTLGQGKLTHPVVTLKTILKRAKHIHDDALKDGHPVRRHDMLKILIIKELAESMLVGQSNVVESKQ
jgi:hypothetical protein